MLIQRSSVLPAMYASLSFLCATTLLSLPANAQCVQWDLGQQPAGWQWGAKQSNGYILGFVFQQNGSNLIGAAEYWLAGEGGVARTQGTLSGTVNGNAIQFTARWNTGPVGHYSGRVNDDGTIAGSTVDAHGNTASWAGHESQKATCVAFASPPAAKPIKKLGKAKAPVATAAPMATVTSDVDVYDTPGGAGRIIGMLRQGSQVPFGGCRDDRWCQVTNVGWVWGDFLAW